VRTQIHNNNEKQSFNLKRSIMKKTILFLGFLMALLQPLAAQDTLFADSPKETYFYNHWVEHDTVLPSNALIFASSYDEEAVAYHSTDSLQIYGLAISLTFGDCEQTHRVGHWVENSMDSTYCRIRLYEPNGSSMRVLGEGRVYMQDPIAYYFSLTRWDGRDPNSQVSPIPVYEVFFDNPVTVIDTFYVGYTFPCTISNPTRYYYLMNSFCQMGERKNPITHALHDCNEDPAPWRIETALYIWNYDFAFAITAPQDTSVVPGDDTTGVGICTNDLIYRYTAVQPNPATDKVRVTSSFGLTRIEAYDLRGRLLFETPASGLKADLDVSSWPRGTYLLRILTPAGPTTKKLLIQ
jgi:hypothetical protein